MPGVVVVDVGLLLLGVWVWVWGIKFNPTQTYYIFRFILSSGCARRYTLVYSMYYEGFKKHLKNKGKKDTVIERNVRTVEDFQSYLTNEIKCDLTDVSNEDISQYVNKIEKERKSAKGFLYVMMNYFRYLGDQELFSHSAQLREDRTSKTRKIFPLKNFLGIDPDIIDKLSSSGITNVKQMMVHGKYKVQRKQLATSLDIPEEAILELVNLSDLTRLGYVKRKLSRLYYDAGIHSPIRVSEFEADELYKYFKAYIEDSGWDGMVPNKKDLENNIQSARKLKEIVEY